MPAPDSPPEPLRRCVEQTVAAEALEGWQPTVEQVDALVALLAGDVTFGDYLAAYRTRYPPGVPGTLHVRAGRQARRGEPYLVPGTTLLLNNFGADTHEMLADLEFVATAGRLAGWHGKLACGDVGARDLNVRLLHRQLFADVYSWAGSYRVTELKRGDDVFARRSSVARMMNRVEARARALVAERPENHTDALADQLARLYADYNYVHPFREGNGRTGTLMLHIVSTLRGRRLDLSTISRPEWYAASRDSMPSGRSRTVDHRTFVPLFVRALD